MLKEDYLINGDTCAILSDFDNYGNEFSMVIEGEHKFLVMKSPNKIVEDSYIFRGFDLNGARNGARFILKEKKNVPVVYSLEPGIILIPCKTLDQRGKIWLINSQICDIKPLNDELTTVHLFGGHSLTVKLKCKTLQKKRSQCSFLLLTVLERINIDKMRFYL